MDRLAGGRSQRPGGAAGAHSAHKAWAGTFGPRPYFGFAGPLGPQNAAAPRRDPTSPPSPSPARLRQPYGGWMWAQEGRGGHAGGGGVFRPGAFGPSPKNPLAAGQSSAAGPWAQPTPAAPGPLRFPPTPKGNAKARPHDLWGLAHKTLSGWGTATTPPLRQSRCPCPTGRGGFIRPAAGYNPLTASPAIARISLSATRVGPVRVLPHSRCRAWFSPW